MIALALSVLWLVTAVCQYVLIGRIERALKRSGDLLEQQRRTLEEMLARRARS